MLFNMFVKPVDPQLVRWYMSNMDDTWWNHTTAIAPKLQQTDFKDDCFKCWKKWLWGGDLSFMSFWTRHFTESFLITSAALVSPCLNELLGCLHLPLKSKLLYQTDRKEEGERERERGETLFCIVPDFSSCMSEPPGISDQIVSLVSSLLFMCANLPAGVCDCVCVCMFMCLSVLF